MSDHIQRIETIAAQQMRGYLVNVAALALEGHLSVCEYPGNGQLAIPNACPVQIDLGGGAHQDDAPTRPGQGNGVRQ